MVTKLEKVQISSIWLEKWLKFKKSSYWILCQLLNEQHFSLLEYFWWLLK